MARRLKYDMPGPDWRVDPESVQEKGWDALFGADLPRPLRLVVEIGFGRGEFLTHLARSDPEAAHVGIEVSFKRVLKMARRLARSELRNIRLVHGPAERILDELLAPGSVGAFWINFPDPWPKKRHHKRRFLTPVRIRSLAERLCPGGVLHVATDHAGYAESIDEALRTAPGLRNLYAPDPYRREVPGRLPTAYELEWRREGRPLFFWAYGRVDTPGGPP